MNTVKPDLAGRDSDQFRLKNYADDNLVIRLVMNNFINKIKILVGRVNGAALYGLDAGCGEGHLLLRLFREGVVNKMVAVDIRSDHLQYAIQFGPHLDYMRGDLCALGLANDIFDFILCTEVLEHLPDPEKTMEELRRVAKPRAHLIVSVPFEPYFSWGNLFRGKYLERLGRTPYHCNFWKREEFKKFIATYIDIDTFYGYRTFPWLLFSGRFH